MRLRGGRDIIGTPLGPVGKPVTVTAGGAALATGDIITGDEDLRATVIDNGLIRFTYELPEGAEPGAGHLHLQHNGTWHRCFRPGYGDWTFFAAPLAVTADRIVVLHASKEYVEISIEWLAHALDVAYLNNLGIVSRDYARNAIFPQSSANPRYITSVHLRKLVRVERGRRGYFVGWHATPELAPQVTAIGQAANNEANLGEREFGTGGGTAVAWASTGNTAYFPAWREQRDWSAVTTAMPSFDNFAWWPGLDDPTYPPWNHATVIAMQPDGYPAEASNGLYYVADIPKANYGGSPNVCRYLVQRHPNEIGVWGYDGQLGEVVNHFTNPWREADGRPTKYPVFIGAEYYEPDATAGAVAGYTGDVDYANEPSAGIRNRIAVLAGDLLTEWPG